MAVETAFDLEEVVKRIHADEITEGGIIPFTPTPQDELLTLGPVTFIIPAYTAPSLTLGHTIIEPDNT